MKILVKVKAGKTIIKESHKVINILNCIKFLPHNENKLSTLRVPVVGFRFFLKIRYEHHKLNNLQNIQISYIIQALMKVKLQSINKSGCSFIYALCLLIFKVKIVELHIA